MSAKPSARMIAVLGSIAGAVDAVAYHVLGHIYVSNMTGNAGAVGMHTAAGKFWDVLQRGFVFFAFFAGVVFGVLIAGHARVTRHDRRTLLFALELGLAAATALLILAFTPNGRVLQAADWRFYVVALLAATSMGVQNISLVVTSDNGPYTTHLTGALTELAHGVAERMLGSREVDLGKRIGLIVGFLVGATLALVVFEWSAFAASLLPVGALAGVLVHRMREVRLGL